jgi:hypothetical protein
MKPKAPPMPVGNVGTIRSHANLLKIFAAFCLLAGCTGKPGDPLTEIGNGIRQGMRDSGFGPLGSGGNSAAIGAAGLKDIMPQYDNTKPLSQQFPHVALTALRAPPNWMGPAMQMNPLTGGYANNRGCWTLTAVVWTNETTSRKAGPFDWCGSRDVQITPGLQAGMGLLKPIDMAYSTGISRTDGPRPPNTLFPEDRHNYKNGYAPGNNLSQFTGSGLWLMYANVMYAMGSTPGRWGDYRIWIVSIDAW